ncbi:MAG: lysophospholipase [Caldivirga sp.]|uniref:alpha/beta hydrolase n=1 Tax=Caldivirga sp. TaxID=2080243 RepID=UPI003D10BC11
MVQNIEGKIPLSTGVSVYYRCWLADKQLGTIIGVHGFAEHSGRYSTFGTFMANNGFSFCMHDLRGHGLTTDPKDLGYVDSFNSFISDLGDFVELMLKKTNVDSAFLLGHSMGGLIVLHYLGRVGRGIHAAITSGAATIVNVNYGTWLLLTIMNSLVPRIRLNLPINPEYLTHDKRIVEEYVNDPLVYKRPTVRMLYELTKASKEVWNYVGNISVPLMMLHGGEDKVVPPKATQEVYNRLKVNDKAIKIYEGMFHEILNELGKDIVYKDILNWLQSHIK